MGTAGCIGNQRWGIWRRLCCLISVGIFFAAPARGADDPDKLYREGRFEEAEALYGSAEMDHPRDLRYRYNRGCAAYQKGDHAGAVAAFGSVLRRTSDPDIRRVLKENLKKKRLEAVDPQRVAGLLQTLGN